MNTPEIKENWFLGDLCINGHEHKNTGKSLRRKSKNNQCLTCQKAINAKFRQVSKEVQVGTETEITSRSCLKCDEVFQSRSKFNKICMTCTGQETVSHRASYNTLTGYKHNNY